MDNGHCQCRDQEIRGKKDSLQFCSNVKEFEVCVRLFLLKGDLSCRTIYLQLFVKMSMA